MDAIVQEIYLNCNLSTVKSQVTLTSWQFQNKMFVRMLTVHCDQNNSYEITINGFQVRKVNEIRNVIFDLGYGKPSLALRPKLGCSPSVEYLMRSDNVVSEFR